MKSGELALDPAPLSVSIQKVPSAILLIPEWPCMGWPLKGKPMPVGRSEDLPSTLPIFSTRLPVVNLPLVCKLAGASLGAAMKVLAGSTACPLSEAGNSVCAFAFKAKAKAQPAVLKI